MCVPPQVALVALSAGSSYLQYKQQKQEAKNAQDRQNRQNAMAKKNAMQRYASEQLKIRQVAKQSSQKGFEGTLKARKARAEFRVGAEGLAMSGSTMALMNDYNRTEGRYKESLATNMSINISHYNRTEGNYKASLQRNMAINISQFERNLEAIQFGQESQSTYVQAPNSAMLFASAVGNVANTYYGMEMNKSNSGQMTNYEKRQAGKRNTSGYTIA